MESNKQYTELEALEYIFGLTSKELDKTVYNRVKTYKKRYKQGELNKIAIEKLLLEFGFTRPDVLFYDRVKDTHLKN